MSEKVGVCESAEKTSDVEMTIAQRLAGAGNLCRDSSANNARQAPIVTMLIWKALTLYRW